MAVVNLSNAPGAVPYVSTTSDQANALLVNALNERTKQYEQQINAIAENEALLSQMKFRDPDRPGMLVRAAKIASDLDKEIQDKYAGDYAATGARKAVARRLAQERGTFQTAQQKYEEEQPYRQLYTQLKATGQLAGKYDPTTGKMTEVNPFSQALVDTEGRLLPTTIDYGDIRKKGDYVDYISKTIVDPLNKRMRDLDIKYKSGPFSGTATSIQGKQVGLDPETAAKQVTDDVAKRFLQENPTFAFEYGADVESAKNYIKDIVRQKAIQQTDYQYGHLTDPLAGIKYKESQTKEPSSIMPPSKLIPKGATPYSLADRGYGNVRDIINAKNTGDSQAADIYQTLKNRLPEPLKKKYESVEKTMPRIWQKDLLNVKGFKSLSNNDKLNLVNELNTLLLDKGKVFDSLGNIGIGQLMAKYGLGDYVKAQSTGGNRESVPGVINWLLNDLEVGAKKAYNTALNISQIATQNIIQEPFLKLVQDKVKQARNYNRRIEPLEGELERVANEGVNYEILGASPMDTQLNKTLSTYFLQYDMKNFKPIGGSKKSSFDETTGYWDKNDYKDINSGIRSVEFERAGAGKPVTYKVTTKSGKSYSMQLDKSRFKDVDAFTSGLSVLTQTPEIHSDEVANAMESQITYTKPMIGKNVMIQKKSPETFRKMVGDVEYNKLVKAQLVNPNEPNIYIIADKASGKPVVAPSSYMNNLVDYFNYFEGVPTPSQEYAYKLRQHKASKKEENEYLKSALESSMEE